MPSEWAKAKAIESPGFKEAAHRSATSDADHDSFMNDFAEALDAARIEGLKEALRIGKENMYSICTFKDIRDRIEEIKR